MKRLLLATTNPGKIREIRAVLAPLGYAVEAFDRFADLHVVEDGDTFEANAVKKALALVSVCDGPAAADDSGLEVDALGGAPGVQSARYAGVDGPEQDAANRSKLLAALAAVPDEQRTARFVCALAYCEPDCAPVFFRGVIEGRIIREERGTNGFGYDSLFLVPEAGRTTAELAPEHKNAISHRGQAVRQLAEYLRAR